MTQQLAVMPLDLTPFRARRLWTAYGTSWVVEACYVNDFGQDVTVELELRPHDVDGQPRELPVVLRQMWVDTATGHAWTVSSVHREAATDGPDYLKVGLTRTPYEDAPPRAEASSANASAGSTARS